MKKLLCILVLFCELQGWAQLPMVAYRKEGVFNYYNTDGKLMWAPAADVAAFPNGWHNGMLKAAGMFVEKDPTSTVKLVRKNLFYNVKGNIALNPKTNISYSIRTGFDNLGFAQLSNNQNNELILINKTGTVVFSGKEGSKSQYLGNGLISFIKNKNDYEKEGDIDYAIYNVLQKKVVNTINCNYFKDLFSSNAIVAVKENKASAIVNKTGKLAFNFDDVIISQEEEKYLIKNYAFLYNNYNQSYNLYNSEGKLVLFGIKKITFTNNEVFTIEHNMNDEIGIYQLKNKNIARINGSINGDYYAASENGALCFIQKDSFVVYNKKLVKQFAIPKTKEAQFINNYLWCKSDVIEDLYYVYDSLGNVVNSIKAAIIDNPAYKHVEFMQNNLWGLAHCSGKVIVKPTCNSGTAPEGIRNGYWLYTVKLNEEENEYNFYNFKGIKVMSTTAKKDSWDYIIPQQEVDYFYSNI